MGKSSFQSSVLRVYGDVGIIRDNTTERVFGFAFFIIKCDREPQVIVAASPAPSRAIGIEMIPTVTNNDSLVVTVHVEVHP